MKWVWMQAVLFVLIVLLPNEEQFELPSWASGGIQVLSVVGFIILFKAVFDLRKSLAISPAPKKNGQLQVHGIYKYIRHPMYVAVWLIFGSSVLRSGSSLKLALFIALVIFFILKVRNEEKLLKNKYPNYEEYMGKVGGFFPKR